MRGWTLLTLLVAACAQSGCGRAEPNVLGQAPATVRPGRADLDGAEVPERLGGPVRDQPAALGADSTLADYLAYAALHSPALEAAFNRWRAAAEGPTQAAALPDPKLTYQRFIQEVETRAGPQRNALQIAQMFPWFGKLRLAAQAAHQAAQATRQRYEAEKLALFQRVKEAYYEYYYLARAVEIARENVALLTSLEAIIRTRYRHDLAGHSDLIRLQVELGKITDRLRSLRDMRAPAMARLAAAMGLPVETPLPAPRELTSARPPLNDGQLIAWAMAHSPLLKADEAEIARRKSQVALARKAYWPNVTLGVKWIDTSHSVGGMPIDDGKDPLIAMLSVNLPIWYDKLDAGVRQSRFVQLAAVKARADRADRLAATVSRIAFQSRDARAKIDLYERLLVPRATASLKATTTAFTAGKAGFSDLIDAQRVLLEFRLTEQRARADHAGHLAMLERLIGRELPLNERKNEDD